MSSYLLVGVGLELDRIVVLGASVQAGEDGDHFSGFLVADVGGGPPGLDDLEDGVGE